MCVLYSENFSELFLEKLLWNFLNYHKPNRKVLTLEKTKFTPYAYHDLAGRLFVNPEKSILIRTNSDILATQAREITIFH